MALKDWKKIKVESGYIFDGKTGFGQYQDVSFYLYKKGWFRGKEDKIVVKVNDKSNPRDSEIRTYASESEALAFIRGYMRSH